MNSTQASDDRSTFDAIETIALVGAIALIAWPALKKIGAIWRGHHPAATQEPAIDESLKETYPASDPPAQRYFDIPVNRR